jgi:hypothetical protein
MMAETVQFDLVADRKGVIWDLLLYIPTVVALASIAASFWYSDDQNMGYLFFFLTCFFFIAGVNRIFKTRLMLFPTSAIALVVKEQSIELNQKNGAQLNLIKNIRYYPDYAGKSFGISGIDGMGKQLQFVFLKGQFASLEKFETAKETLKGRFK